MLKELLSGIDKYVVHGPKEPVITGLSYDSRKTGKNHLFFCIKGFKWDGHDFAQEAVKNGASAIITEKWMPLPDEVTQIVVKDTRLSMAIVSANFYGHPARDMTVIGVTGTNGKTTTTYMIKAIGERFGKKVGLIGTIKNMIGQREIATVHTTPESLDLQRLLREMRDEGVEWVVMEVSSHSLELKRVGAMIFDEAIFTNLTQDHLDFHGTLENYRAAKKILFSNCKTAIVNADDESAEYMTAGADYPVYTFGIREKADYSARDIEITDRGVSFTLKCPAGEIPLVMNIPGIFTVYNSMAAASACCALGVPVQVVKEGLESVTSIAGRFEVIDTRGRDYTVILDYAHTPDGLENILRTAKEFAKGRIVTLFGCGGDRDRTKRPIMGKIAGKYSDFCIITSDNPRTEEPMSIIKAIETGMKESGCEYIAIENRIEAIRFALENARKNDIIILAGKGHETYQEINGVRSHFDEKEIVGRILAEMDGKQLP